MEVEHYVTDNRAGLLPITSYSYAVEPLVRERFVCRQSPRRCKTRQTCNEILEIWVDILVIRVDRSRLSSDPTSKRFHRDSSLGEAIQKPLKHSAPRTVPKMLDQPVKALLVPKVRDLTFENMDLC